MDSVVYGLCFSHTLLNPYKLQKKNLMLGLHLIDHKIAEKELKKFVKISIGLERITEEMEK